MKNKDFIPLLTAFSVLVLSVPVFILFWVFASELHKAIKLLTG